MFRKLFLVTLMFGFLAACATQQQKMSDEMASSGRWFSAFLALEKYKDDPSSSAFKNFAEKSKAEPNFEQAITAEFTSGVGDVIMGASGPTEKRNKINALSHAVSLLEKYQLVSPGGIGQMYESFDGQTAAAYSAGQIQLGLHDVPVRARQLAAAMVQQPQTAFDVTWQAVRGGNYDALGTLLQIGRDVAAQGNNQIEQMALSTLQAARLPFPAWTDHVLRYHPDLAHERMRALETRLVAQFDFQNRLLGYQTREKLSALAPDVRFVEKAEESEGILVIRELMFQTNGPNVRQQRQSVSRDQFNYYDKKNYPNIAGAVWTEMITEMSGHWAIQLELQNPDGSRITERMTRGEKTEMAIQCSKPSYVGFGDERPSGWPTAEVAKRCENKTVPVTRQDYFQDLAINATLDSALSIIGSLRKVDDPTVSTSPAEGEGSWKVQSAF